jgi:Fur family ferric uptake transcriptional regulator
MTLAPHRPPLPFGDLDEVVEAIRLRGGRLSSARRVLLEALFAAEGPVSADYIAQGMGGRITRSDLSSVYRNLELLEELGVVRHVHLGHGPALYELERGRACGYLVCERCNRVDAVDAEELEGVRAEVRTRFGFQVRFSHFPIVGLCPACLAEADPPST